jgi:hypothetical protein
MSGKAVIGVLRVNLGIGTAQFQQGLANAQSALQRFGSIAKVGLTAAAAAAGAAVGAMGVEIKRTIDAADDMSKAASRIGIGTEELSKLAYAAKLSGVEFGTLESSLGRLSKNMAEAFAGSEAAAKRFEQFGISIRNTDGTLMSTSDVMTAIADKMAAMPDGAEKTAMAMELMGRGGAAMIPLLNGGSQALGDLMAEAETFGQVFTAEMGKSAEQFNDNLSRLTGTFGALAATIATAVLPGMVRLTDIAVDMAASFHELSPAMQTTIVAVGGLATAALVAVPVLAGLSVAVGAISAPVAAIALGVAAATTAVVLFWPEIQTLAGKVMELGGALQTFVTGAWTQFVAAWDTVTVKVNEVSARVQQFATEIVTWFAALPAQMMAIGGQIIDGLWQGISAKWEEVKANVAAIPTWVTDTWKDLWQIQSPSRVMHEIGANLMAGLNEGITSMQGQMVSTAEGIGGTLTDSFADLASGLSGQFASAFGSIIEGTKSAKEAFTDLAKSIAQMFLNRALQGIFEQIFGSVFGNFAAGGIAASAAAGAAGAPALAPQNVGDSAGAAVTVINNTGQPSSARETTDNQGNRRIEVTVGEMVAGEMRRGGSALNQATRGTFALKPALVGR